VSTDAASAHTYDVTVVANDEVNAFALPGGRIVVWTGLVAHAESAEQIAGVLAHEIAHVERRHGLRNVVYRAGLVLGLRLLVAIFLGVDLDGFTALATDAAALAMANDYSQGQESEADADAVLRMHAAGLDPTALAGFFRVMSRTGVGDLPAIASWLSTHPDHASRIAAMEAQARALPPSTPRPLEVDLDAARAALE
jgi:predicted Zn-dependent protease